MHLSSSLRYMHETHYSSASRLRSSLVSSKWEEGGLQVLCESQSFLYVSVVNFPELARIKFIKRHAMNIRRDLSLHRAWEPRALR